MTHPPNLHIEERVFDAYSQLAYASRGVMDVRTAVGRWIVPPHRAVWIPARTRHSVHMTGRVSLRTLFFRRGLARGRVPTACQAVNVTPLLRELILQATKIGLLHRVPAKEERLAYVILDQIERLPVIPLQLPMPRDERARRAAEVIVRSCGDDEAIDAAVHRAGASRRTLERTFLEETNMTLGRWRQRVRLLESLRLLAQGHSVTRVALDVGYNTPSAFIAAFRRQLGVTPGRYFANR